MSFAPRTSFLSHGRRHDDDEDDDPAPVPTPRERVGEAVIISAISMTIGGFIAWGIDELRERFGHTKEHKTDTFSREDD